MPTSSPADSTREFRATSTDTTAWSTGAETQVPPPEALAAAVRARLDVLYALAPESAHLRASPLGPFHFRGQTCHLPRFVFFGPKASEASWRLAFFAGLDQRDTRAADALLATIEDLAEHADDAHGLDLTFFPLVNAAGFFLGAPPRPLASEHWGRSAAPELQLLEREARAREYHGFVRVETAHGQGDELGLRVRAPADSPLAPDVELISSEDTEPYPVRFETGQPPLGGPLSIADDLPHGPFELTLRVPAAWPVERYRDAVRAILQRFVRRYRAFQAYGQHL